MNARSLTLAGMPAHGQTPKRGGMLNAMLGEDPPGRSTERSGWGMLCTVFEFTAGRPPWRNSRW